MLHGKRWFGALVAAMIAAATLGSALPASAWDGTVAAAPCRADVGIRIDDYGQAVVVVGAFTAAGATDVVFTCGIVRSGTTVARVGEKIPGPVAVVEGTQRIGVGSFSMCYEALVTYLDRVQYLDSCP